MPGQRKQLQIAKRRQQVAELYLQSWTQAEIARHLSVSQATVSADLKKVAQQWRDSALRDFDLARGEQLAKLQRVEREAWDAWHRSLKPAETAVVSGEAPGERKLRRSVKHQHGDPRLLEVIHKCIASHRALLGLDAVTVKEDADEQLDPDLRRARLLTLVDSAHERQAAQTAGTGPGGEQPGAVRVGDQQREVEAGPTSGLPGRSDR